MGKRNAMLTSGLVFVVIALFTAPIFAECPNGCSGNGACMAKDMCNCYKNYQGNDCMDRTCQFGYAHADTPKGDINMDQLRTTANWILTDSQQDPAGTYEFFNPDAATNEAHFYMECSNKGLCDRSLGTCTCFDGYEGVACQRAACPNKCSGHGTCESLRELGLKTTGTLFGNPDNVNQITYDLWDSRVTYGCRCDPWYEGPDCSLRSCKVGVDPMYLSVGTAIYTVFALHVWLDATLVVQVETFPSSNIFVPVPRAVNAGDWVRLRLFDFHGEAFVTDAIAIVSDLSDTAADSLAFAKANAVAVAAAIKKIPNQTFSKVICEPTNGANVGTDLVGYKSTRTAATYGLSVVCQLPDNPGRLRNPEIVSYNFGGVVDPGKKFASLYVMEKGHESEWFTEDSGILIKGITAASVTAGTFNVLEIASTTQTDADNTLFKVGSHVVLGKIASATTITLVFPIKHALGSTNNRFNVNSASGMVVDTGTATSAAVAVGATTITFAALPPLVVGNTIFFENQFFKVKAVAAASPFTITLDRPFGGNSIDGLLSAISTKVYKVTPPADAYKYNYISQCSGRGLCTPDTGVCACFKGYTNDNCNTQNILAL
ncbi:Tenascin-X [Phytophthora citrophthora]|uniref:Tenascin-X n=1 Tax=Phytophthora citrophthora TaxID=4793 RepID=A0AAD9G381_9STRA|nr:Tenascin-X [Phytophthora citrophthora]